MKRILSLLTCLSIIFTTSIVRADDLSLPPAPSPVEGEIDVGAAISPMKKGDKAVFTGLLLSPRAVATVMAQINALKGQIKIEVDRTKGEERARCEFRVSEQRNVLETDKKILQVQLESTQKDLQMLSTRLKEERAVQQNAQLWTGLGFAGGVVATIVTVFAVKSVIK
jgi:hypothetical protein